MWYADRDGGKVGRLDPWTLLPVGKPIQVGGKPGWLASAGRSLFVADPARGTVTEIDLRSGVAERPAIRVGPPAKDASIVAVVAAGNSVWVSNFTSSTLTRVRTAPVDVQLIASIRVPPEGVPSPWVTAGSGR